MKTLFIGGIKSGKSKNAEEYTLKRSQNKPTYLATTEFFDDEMKKKVNLHKIQRGDNFETLEESLELSKVIQNQKGIVLIECISMWINNMLYHGFSEDDMIDEIKEILSKDVSVVFVINDVSCSVVSDNALVRKFVDMNGKISQLLASSSNEVYNTVAGISVRIK